MPSCKNASHWITETMKIHVFYVGPPEELNLGATYNYQHLYIRTKHTNGGGDQGQGHHINLKKCLAALHCAAPQDELLQNY